MAEYEIFTRTILERSYSFTLTPAIDMGDSNDRISDLMMRKAVNNGTLNLDDMSAHLSEIADDEEITTIMRDGKTIWSRARRRNREPQLPAKPALQTTIDEVLENQD